MNHIVKPAQGGVVASIRALVSSLKATRNSFVDTCFRSLESPDFPRLIAECTGNKFVCFSIAFNTPWVIDLLLRFWNKNIPDVQLVVADNSSSRSAAREIRMLCERHSRPYIKLPINPEWNPNRSHGIAANWLYYNVVKLLRPEYFGFIDHDCFPISRFKFMERVRGHSVYGFHHQVIGCPQWNLWAGFAFFDFNFTDGFKFDFKPWHEFGLDTGGRNWRHIYSRVASDKLRAATFRRESHFYRDTELKWELIDDAFLHVGGASYAPQTRRRVYREHMQAYLTETYLNRPTDGIQ